MAQVAAAEPEVEQATRRVSAPVQHRVAAHTEVVTALAEAEIDVADIGLRRPTLDDVFLRLTGHRTDAAPDPTDDQAEAA